MRNRRELGHEETVQFRSVVEHTFDLQTYAPLMGIRGEIPRIRINTPTGHLDVFFDEKTGEVSLRSWGRIMIKPEAANAVSIVPIDR